MARILIIGAGASGLMAAISAAECGAEVTVLEHKQESGIKLALTGNGRCNYTNTHVSADKYHCDETAKRHFIETVLEQFGYEECIAFFKRLGIEPEIKHYSYDDSGYVYPKGLDAAEFRDVMYRAALERGVRFHFAVDDEAIAATVMSVLLRGAYEVGGHDAEYDSVIIASGSNAYPVTGSDSSIYPVLMELGVKPYRFLPALCALYSKDELLRELKGRRIKSETVLRIGKTEYRSCGEVQFNEHSISGIPVMQLSRYAAQALNEGEQISLSIDGHDYRIHRTAGFDRAQTCTGGIDTADIDPETMRYRESLSARNACAENMDSPCGASDTADSTDCSFRNDNDSDSANLYFCGEIIDIDGECGGYNLHFAWASGYIAGTAAANSHLYRHDKDKSDKNTDI